MDNMFFFNPAVNDNNEGAGGKMHLFYYDCFLLFTAGDLTFFLASGRNHANGKTMRTDSRSQSSNETKKFGNSSVTNVLILKSLK